MNQKKGIRVELSRIWRRNVIHILDRMDILHQELAERCGLKRSSITTMLTREDYHLTGIQFLATMYVIRQMIAEADLPNPDKRELLDCLNEIENDYQANGLF